jgi:predicted transcriptional regulator
MKNNSDLIGRLNATMMRNGLSRSGLAKYYGVPDQTVYKWLDGERTPNAATMRLIDVMETIEILAPGIHAALMPDGIKTGNRKP